MFFFVFFVFYFFVSLFFFVEILQNQQVKNCIRQLIFYNCVVLIDIFLYTNVYATTARVDEFLSVEEFQRSCVTYVTLEHHRVAPTPKCLFELYSSLKPGKW